LRASEQEILIFGASIFAGNDVRNIRSTLHESSTSDAFVLPTLTYLYVLEELEEYSESDPLLNQLQVSK